MLLPLEKKTSGTDICNDKKKLFTAKLSWPTNALFIKT
jgi:hypothetical protein